MLKSHSTTSHRVEKARTSRRKGKESIFASRNVRVVFRVCDEHVRSQRVGVVRGVVFVSQSSETSSTRAAQTSDVYDAASDADGDVR